MAVVSVAVVFADGGTGTPLVAGSVIGWAVMPAGVGAVFSQELAPVEEVQVLFHSGK